MSERFHSVYESLSNVKEHPMPPDEFREFISHIKSEIISKCTRFNNFDWRRDPTIVDDLAQQVCMEIYSSLHRFDSNRGTFKNWVDFIALNTVRNYVRSQVRKPPPDSLDKIVEDGIRSDSSLMSVSPELLILAKAKRKQLLQLMVQLQKSNPNYYHVLYCRAYLGMTPEETATTLDCDVESVYRNTNRALQKLRKWVRELHADG